MFLPSYSSPVHAALLAVMMYLHALLLAILSPLSTKIIDFPQVEDSNSSCSDWFRLETLDDSLQPTIDMLLNLSVFLWFGAVCPWSSFAHNDVIPIYRLIFLGILILLLRRVPVVFALHWKIWQIEQKQQALFVGFFGPIGVSAVFYLYISLEFLGLIQVDEVVRDDAARLQDVMTTVIWFLAICSIVSCSMGRYMYIIADSYTQGCPRFKRSHWQVRLPLTAHRLQRNGLKSQYHGSR